MTGLEFLKLGHEAKDVKDVADITRYIKKIEIIAQQGKWSEVAPLIGEILDKYETEVNQYHKGRTPAKTPQEAASSCHQFLMELLDQKAAKKTAEKLAEESLKHLGGN